MPRDANQQPQRASQFLAVASEFHLGSLLTESSHPATSDLSDAASRRAEDGLTRLFAVDGDVVRTFAEWSHTEQPTRMADAAVATLRQGGRLFFTGCGATGRLSIQLDSTWRGFWQDRRARGASSPPPDLLEDRTRSVMAGGDYALIKSVEGFEDFAPFGRRQIADLGVGRGDTVFAITEGGETSFVIGTAWQGLEAGARVFFVYNNPDDVLRAYVRRTREVLDEPRIEKVNLSTGPMAITGSTRMQATSIQLLAMLVVMEMVLRELLGPEGRRQAGVLPSAEVPHQARAALDALHEELQGPLVLGALASLVQAEERTYRGGRRTSYFARSLAVDVLTDTTERSPTFCTPSFRKRGDTEAADSWSFLFTPTEDTERAWRTMLRREPQTIEWTDDTLRELLGEEAAARQSAVLQEIGREELMRFRIGLDGLADRPIRRGDAVTAVVSPDDIPFLLDEDNAFTRALCNARDGGGAAALVAVARREALDALRSTSAARAASYFVPLLVTGAPFLLEPMVRVGVKMLLNALSTCTMVRLGRVLGNRMIWVVPSNLKLIDRATRYVRDLAGVPYEDACRMLFRVIDYIEPRRSAGQTYPPPVAVAVMCLKEGIHLEEAEGRLRQL